MAGDGKGEDHLRAVGFAAGTAAFMACVERAVVVSVFVHWRAWVFLALNLLLLAILFTSKSQPPSDEGCREKDAGFELAFKKKKRRKDCGGEVVEPPRSCGGETAEPPGMEHGEECGKKEDDHNDDELSMDELNQRAEAFIASFRQHLAYDARGKRHCSDQKRVSHTARSVSAKN